MGDCFLFDAHARAHTRASMSVSVLETRHPLLCLRLTLRTHSTTHKPTNPQSKYTHLVDQDTTNFDSAWSQADGLNRKNLQKMGGMGAVDRPFKRKRT